MTLYFVLIVSIVLNAFLAWQLNAAVDQNTRLVDAMTQTTNERE